MGIKDKAKNLNFQGVLGPAPAVSKPSTEVVPESSASHRPKTAPGAMMAFAAEQRSELLREVDELKAQVVEFESVKTALDEAKKGLKSWEGAKAARKLDPRKIKRSVWANRHDDSYLNSDFAALRNEIQNAGGNVQPIKVRRIPGEDYEYEVVYGHRRHQACLELGLPVLALLDETTDVELFIEMDRENRSRKDLSPWEQGMMYRSALRSGLFVSNRKLAEAVGIDLGNLGRLLKLADLPPEVIKAFQSPLDLQFRHAKPLTDALTADFAGVIARAKELSLAGHRLSGSEVFNRLIVGQTTEGATVPSPPPSDQVVPVHVSGRRVADLRIGLGGGVSLLIEPGVVGSERISGLAQVIEAYLSDLQ